MHNKTKETGPPVLPFADSPLLMRATVLIVLFRDCNVSDEQRMSGGLLSAAHELRSAGYAFFPSYQPCQSSESVAGFIGAKVWPKKSGLVQELKPKHEGDAPPTTYSGIYGSNVFPFHTDLAHWRFPPRFLMLRCVAGYDAVITMVVDGAEIIKKVGPVVLSRAIVRPRRRVEGIFPLLRIYDRKEHQGLLRWDEVFIRPASRAGELGVAKLKEYLDRSTPIRIPLAKRGDTLIIDNWRMLHGRSSVPLACNGRLIERMYLESVL